MTPLDRNGARSAARRVAGKHVGETSVLVASALVLLLTIATFATTHPNPLGVAWAVALCLASALCWRWSLASSVSMGVLLTAGLLLPSGLPFSSFATVIPITVAGARGLARLRLFLVLWYGGALSADILIQSKVLLGAPQVVEVLTSLFALFVLYAAAWLAGSVLLNEARRQQELQREKLAALRRGIAADLHDTVAYTLSVIAIRADQARLKGGGTVADLSFIADSSRQAIADIRGIMTLLRREGQASDEAVTWSVESLADMIEHKTAELRRAGITVTTTLDGDPATLPRSVHDTVAKVLHEALSNVGRHAAPASACALILNIAPTEVEVAVFNDLTASPRPTRKDTLGVLGMRERVEGVGGTLVAGPIGQRWAVQATIPLINHRWEQS